MEIVELDLRNAEDVAQLLLLVEAYYLGPSGGNRGLSPDQKSGISALVSKYTNLIAFAAQEDGQSLGVVIGSRNLFVLSAKPYVNIQFIFVHPDYRGRGIAKQLMHAMELKAVAEGCFKVTLEVRENNIAAKALYRGMGYARATFGPNNEVLEFWEHSLG